MSDKPLDAVGLDYSAGVGKHDFVVYPGDVVNISSPSANALPLRQTFPHPRPRSRLRHKCLHRSLVSALRWNALQGLKVERPQLTYLLIIPEEILRGRRGDDSYDADAPRGGPALIFPAHVPFR
jgi:hypothetical protein